jgi:hypothetical protein
MRAQYIRNPAPWCYVAEALSKHIVPPKIRELLATVATLQLLKKDEDGRYTANSKTRPIGKVDRLLADCLRQEVSDDTKILGKLLILYGQYAVAIPSGGEAVGSAIQARCTNDSYVVTIFTDASNAYCRLDPEDEERAIRAAIQHVTDMTEPELPPNTTRTAV